MWTDSRYRLYRDPANGVFAGVCAGIARYFGVERKPREVNSITKSVTNLAVGKLHGAGKLSLDEPVSSFFTEWMAGPKQDVTD